MSLALVHSRARVGVHAPEVRVEVHLSGGLPSTQIVGLPEAAVRESRERVRAALLCAQFEFPARRITINLAPADLPKEGGRFDLPIALGILAASGQIDRQALADYEFLGELALTGELRGVDGVLPAALAAAQAGRRLIVPLANGAEAAIAGHVEAFTARTLLDVCATLNGSQKAPAAELAVQALGARALPDMADVRGQPHARRALEIAAAGGHHLLLVGSPGCGKTLLASRLPGLLPEASEAEALETAAITSISGRGLDLARWRQRPYRAPHHTASAVALVGCELAESAQLGKEDATLSSPCRPSGTGVATPATCSCSCSPGAVRPKRGATQHRQHRRRSGGVQQTSRHGVRMSPLSSRQRLSIALPLDRSGTQRRSRIWAIRALGTTTS